MRAAEMDGASIVMIGSFNPAIFQPRWLGVQGLIRPEEAETAKITVIQAEVADFSTEWFQVQVLQNRLMLASVDPRHYAALRDLCAGIFDLLPHTPITAFGINRQFHFSMPSIEAWHSIGHRLAPKDAWNPIMEKPGLRSMTIQGLRKQIDPGILYIKVEPSLRINPGVFVEVNEEFRPSDDRQTQGAGWVRKPLNDHWDVIMNFSEEAAEHILSFGKQ